MEKPRQLDPLADRVLTLLSSDPEARQIVLGEYFALQQYVDYRMTHDVDAWWAGRADPAVEAAIGRAMLQAAAEQGMDLSTRRFGETVSFELSRDGVRRFSFRIATRSVALEQAGPSAWLPIRIETLADNIGSKMNALVNRGAPRDFMDIKAIIDAGLATDARCWELWLAKNPGASQVAGRQNVLLHLAGLEARRPLETIADPEARARARALRQFFMTVFAKA